MFHNNDVSLRALELCESRGGRPGLPVSNSSYGLCGRKATLNERTNERTKRTNERLADDSASPLFHSDGLCTLQVIQCRAQQLCESRGGHPELPVPNSPYGLCGRKAALNERTGHSELRSCVKVEVAVLCRPFLIVIMVSVDVKQP